MKLHITRINSKPATRKDGSLVLTKTGKQMYKVGIQTAEFGDIWLNGLVPFNPDRWEGSEQELVVSDTQYGKEFKLPPRDAAVPSQTPPAEGLGEVKLSITNIHRKLDDLNRKVDSIIGHLTGMDPLDRASDGSPLPNFDRKLDNEPLVEEEHLEQLAKEYATK